MSAVAAFSFYLSFSIAARASIVVGTARWFKACYSAKTAVATEGKAAVTASSADTDAACATCSCVAAVSVATSTSHTGWSCCTNFALTCRAAFSGACYTEVGSACAAWSTKSTVTVGYA
jgi:hypothetical protein